MPADISQRTDDAINVDFMVYAAAALPQRSREG